MKVAQIKMVTRRKINETNATDPGSAKLRPLGMKLPTMPTHAMPIATRVASALGLPLVSNIKPLAVNRAPISAGIAAYHHLSTIVAATADPVTPTRMSRKPQVRVRRFTRHR